MRRARESSELRREGSWRGQWQRGSPARHAAPPDAWGDSWLHASELHGPFATSWHGNFTSSRQTARVLVIHSEHLDFLSSSTKLKAASVRIAIDDSTRAKLRITVRASQPPYSQLYAQFERAHHALRQPQHIFAMKLARVLSTSTRKAGHTPRLPPPTRDVAAEVP